MGPIDLSVGHKVVIFDRDSTIGSTNNISILVSNDLIKCRFQCINIRTRILMHV